MATVIISQLPPPPNETGTGSSKGTDLFPATDITNTSTSPTGQTNKYTLAEIFNWMLTAQGLVTYNACQVATTSSLSANYSNGSSGVGATLTHNGTLATLAIDGVTLQAGARVLVWQQSSEPDNGIYFVTNNGSASTAWVLTRATDYNTPAQIIQNGVVLVNQGLTYSGILFQETGAGPFIFGTTNIIFSEYAVGSEEGAINTVDADSGSIVANSGVITISGGSTGLTTSGSSSTMDLVGTLAISNGGTSQTSVTVVPAASSWSGWDTHKNFSSNNVLEGYTTTTTAASTTTLTVSSTYNQFFTGSTTQSLVMPVTSTLVDGFPFYIVNNSSGNVTVKSSGGNTIQVMAAGTTAYLTCIAVTGTTAASWNCEYAFNGGEGSGTVNSGTSGDLAYYSTTGTAVSALTTGTGVITALGVNVGTAGSFVVEGGALGAPSSGNLVNCTGLTNAQLPQANYALSSSSGNFTTTSATFAAVTNLSVTLTTAGRPVMITLVPDGTSNVSVLGCSSGTGVVVTYGIFNGVTNIGQGSFGTTGTTVASYAPGSSCAAIDTSVAGTYTWTFQVLIAGGNTANVQYFKLLAWEI